MRQALIKYLPDAMIIIGAAGVSYGFWLIRPQAGYIVAGVFMIIAGIFLARNE